MQKDHHPVECDTIMTGDAWGLAAGLLIGADTYAGIYQVKKINTAYCILATTPRRLMKTWIDLDEQHCRLRLFSYVHWPHSLICSTSCVAVG